MFVSCSSNCQTSGRGHRNPIYSLLARSTGNPGLLTEGWNGTILWDRPFNLWSLCRIELKSRTLCWYVQRWRIGWREERKPHSWCQSVKSKISWVSRDKKKQDLMNTCYLTITTKCTDQLLPEEGCVTFSQDRLIIRLLLLESNSESHQLFK